MTAEYLKKATKTPTTGEEGTPKCTTSAGMSEPPCVVAGALSYAPKPIGRGPDLVDDVRYTILSRPGY